MRNPYLKLSWAKHHLEALDIEIRKFCTSSSARAITREDDLENQRHILRIQLVDVPDHICLIAGDAFYNMRSALDQLVWSLARLSGIPKRTQFPIVERLTIKSLERFNKQLSGVPPGAICEIEALQPFHRGAAFKTHPLWRLDEICNLDKHRRIPANGSVADLFFPDLTPEDLETGTVRLEISDDQGEVSIPIALKHKMKVDPTFSVSVNFGGDTSGISESLNEIAEIYNFVAQNVLPRFASFFS